MKNRHHEKEEELLRKPIERVSVSYKEGLNDILVQERIEKGWNNRAVESPEKTNKQIVKENVFTYFNLIFLVLSVFCKYFLDKVAKYFWTLLFCNFG